MIVAGVYSFNRGREVIEAGYPSELRETLKVIQSVDSAPHRTKLSKEITMPGRALYDPKSLSQAFGAAFAAKGWSRRRVRCEYPTECYDDQVDTALCEA